MKLKKILQKVEILLNPAKEEQRQHNIKGIKKLLKKLRAHEKALHKKLAKTYDESDRQKIRNKIALVHAQRKKGLATLKKQ